MDTETVNTDMPAAEQVRDGEPLLSFKCPSCGAALTYNAETERFLCAFCEGSFDLEEVKNAAVNAEKPYDWGDYKQNVGSETVEGTRTYVCSSCGAEIVTDAVTVATHCPYCDNNVVVESGVSGFVKPNGIIPFKVDKKRLSELLKEYCKGKILLPGKFLSEQKIQETQGIYVPFWLFDCTVDGDTTYEATRVHMWSDSQYNYTKTDYYGVEIDGSLSFRHVPADGSKKLDDALMDSIEPYDFSQLEAFAPGYLSGFLADRFDVDADASLPRADKRVKQSMDEVFRRQLHGYASVVRMSSHASLKDTEAKYVLLPVYLITSHYRDKLYTFAVNGQTGRMTGDLPISRVKFWGLFLGIAAALSALLLLVV